MKYNFAVFGDATFPVILKFLASGNSKVSGKLNLKWKKMDVRKDYKLAFK